MQWISTIKRYLYISNWFDNQFIAWNNGFFTEKKWNKHSKRQPFLFRSLNEFTRRHLQPNTIYNFPIGHWKLAITRWHLSLLHGPGALRLLCKPYGCFKPEHVFLTTIVSFAIYSVVALLDCISIRAASYALSLLPTHLIILHLHAFLSNNVSHAGVLLLCRRRRRLLLLLILLIRFALLRWNNYSHYFWTKVD